MDFDGDRDVPVSIASGYSRLNDAQLRGAIRFAEAHLRSVEEAHEALRSAYRDEIAMMRSHFVDRLLARILARARSLSEQQGSELRRRFERRTTRRYGSCSTTSRSRIARIIQLSAGYAAWSTPLA
jgi:hypothetical protein